MNKDENVDDASYAVGYGKPPKATRFKPDQSGNPRGRPRKPKTIGEMFDRELGRKLAIREDGKLRKVPKMDLLVKRIVADAIKGDHSASRMIMAIRQARDDELAEGAAAQAVEELTAGEREILERYISELALDTPPGGTERS